MVLVLLQLAMGFSPGPVSRLAVTPTAPTLFVNMAGWGPEAGTWEMPTSSEELADVVTQAGVIVVFFGSTRCRACQAARSACRKASWAASAHGQTRGLSPCPQVRASQQTYLRLIWSMCRPYRWCCA